MALFNAAFEVAPSGTAIPWTGGADGFSDGYTGGGASFVSDSSVPAAVASGTLAAKITVGGSAQNWRGWFLSGSTVHVRSYVYLTGSPNARFTWWENYASGAGLVSRIRINTDRTVAVGTPSSSWFTTAAIPLNTLVRIEASFAHAAGTMSLDLYAGNSTTPIAGGSVSVTGVTFGGTNLTGTYGGILSTVTNFTIRTDAWGASDTGRLGPVLSGGTVTGVTAATATVQADAGTVEAVVGGVVTITGVTPQVVAQGGVRPEPPAPPEGDPLWPPDPYREAIRSGGHQLFYSVAASFAGVPVEGATDLRPVGGSIVDTTKPGVRRTLNLSLSPEPGLFDKLAPLGTRLAVTATVTYLNRTTQDIPMGVFEVDSEKLSEGGGGLSVTAPDKWARIQAARFPLPTSSRAGVLVVDQIADLVRGALGSSEVVRVSATSTALVGALTWEKDRDKAIIALADGIGAWVYFDREGICTIADRPTVGSSADWLIDASATGVLTELDRERSRAGTCNVVVVESSATDETARFATQVVWDNDPNSPTYAGPDPINSPELAGPFGVAVDYFDTPLPLGNDGALRAAYTRLARVAGLASQVSLGQVPNPAVDAADVLDVLPPKERSDIPRVLERHMADTVTHPLTGGAQSIEGRSTRADDLGV